MSETSRTHKSEAAPSSGILIVTCSTSRFRLAESGEKYSDPAGDIIEHLVRESGHKVCKRTLVPDSSKILLSTLLEAIQNPDVDSIIITGGTGISPDDVTVEIVERLFDKALPGFGEAFRRISYDEIGSPAILTRATAGIASKKPIFCIPGSPDAVKKSLDKLILPELAHILKHARGS